jgi:hypothetical protein
MRTSDQCPRGTSSKSLTTVDSVAALGPPIVVPMLVAEVRPRAAKRFGNFFGSSR